MHHPLQSELLFFFFHFGFCYYFYLTKNKFYTWINHFFLLFCWGGNYIKLSFSQPSQVECNANMANSSDETNTINPDVSNVDGATQKSDTDNKIKNISNRIAKRSYRRRSDSQSSTNSVPMDEPMPEQSNENSMNSNRNNREVSKKKKVYTIIFFLSSVQHCSHHQMYNRQ